MGSFVNGGVVSGQAVDGEVTRHEIGFHLRGIDHLTSGHACIERRVGLREQPQLVAPQIVSAPLVARKAWIAAAQGIEQRLNLRRLLRARVWRFRTERSFTLLRFDDEGTVKAEDAVERFLIRIHVEEAARPGCLEHHMRGRTRFDRRDRRRWDAGNCKSVDLLVLVGHRDRDFLAFGHPDLRTRPVGAEEIGEHIDPRSVDQFGIGRRDGEREFGIARTGDARGGLQSDRGSGAAGGTDLHECTTFHH